MIVVLEHGATAEQIAEVVAALKARGIEAHAVVSEGRTLLHVASGSSRRARHVQHLDQVAALVPTSGPRIRSQGQRLFPFHFLQVSAYAIALLGVLLFLAGTFPPGIGVPIDVENPPEEIEHPAYTRALRALLALFPDSLAWLVLLATAAVLLLVPRIDRDPARTLRQRLPIVALGTALVLAVCYLTLREVIP